MNTDSLAKIYARALLEAADGSGLLEDVLEEVKAFLSMLEKNADLRIFIESPKLEKSQKLAVLRKCLEGKVSKVFLNYLLVVIEKNRQAHLVESLDAFLSLHDEKVGRVRASVTSAVPISEEVMNKLRDALAARIEKEVILTPRVDPGVLGGLVVRYDGMVADGSLRTALERVRSRMLTPKFGSELVHED